MSLENAILEHAAAIRELAAAFIQLSQVGAPVSQLREAYAAGKDVGKSVGARGPTADEKPRGTTKNEAADNQAKIEAERDAELEQAVTRVEADAKKNAGAADTQTSTAGDTAGSATGAAGTEQAEPLSYEKDVKPLLVEYARVTDKDTMTKYVRSFGVQKAPELPADKFAEIIAGAKNLIAEAAKAA